MKREPALHAVLRMLSPGAPLLAVVLMGAAQPEGCSGTDTSDADGDGWTAAAGDCDDYNASVNPSANEVCGDAIDNDCDGVVDNCGTPSGATACYLGSNRANNTCFGLVPMSSPPPSGYTYSSSCQTSYGSAYAKPTHLLDLNGLDGSVLLAPNFRLDEIAQSYKGRYAVIQSHAITSLQAVRDVTGPLVVNSGYRSPDYNASLDGASCSRHTYGDGFDLDPSSVSLTSLGDVCYSKGAGYVQLYETHVHCDWRDDSLDDSYYRTSGDAFVESRPELMARMELHDGVLTAPAFGWDEGEPLRQWVALDERGGVLDEASGRSYVAPRAASSVQVTVGGELVVEMQLR